MCAPQASHDPFESVTVPCVVKVETPLIAQQLITEGIIHVVGLYPDLALEPDQNSSSERLALGLLWHWSSLVICLKPNKERDLCPSVRNDDLRRPAWRRATQSPSMFATKHAPSRRYSVLTCKYDANYSRGVSIRGIKVKKAPPFARHVPIRGGFLYKHFFLQNPSKKPKFFRLRRAKKQHFFNKTYFFHYFFSPAALLLLVKRSKINVFLQNPSKNPKHFSPAALFDKKVQYKKAPPFGRHVPIRGGFLIEGAFLTLIPLMVAKYFKILGNW